MTWTDIEDQSIMSYFTDDFTTGSNNSNSSSNSSSNSRSNSSNRSSNSSSSNNSSSNRSSGSSSSNSSSNMSSSNRSSGSSGSSSRSNSSSSSIEEHTSQQERTNGRFTSANSGHFFYPDILSQEEVLYQKEFHRLFQDEYKLLQSNGVQKYRPHQSFIARFLSPLTPFDRLLAIHETGTGKSGCVSALYDEWKKRTNNEFIFIYLTSNDSTKVNFMFEFKKLSREYDQNRKTNSNNIFIDKYAKVELNRLRKRIEDELSPVHPILIVIDEAHNLISNNSFDDEKTNERYETMVEFLASIENRTTILACTGTPIRHEIKEIIPLLNLIVPETIPNDFFTLPNWEEKFNEICKRYVSYFRFKKEKYLEIEFVEGETKHNQESFRFHYPVFFETMSSFQTNSYLDFLFHKKKKK